MRPNCFDILKPRDEGSLITRLRITAHKLDIEG